MKKLLLLMALIPLLPTQATFKKPSAYDLDFSRKRCTPPTPIEDTPTGDLVWNQTPKEMAALAQKIYNSPGRLRNRTFYDSKLQKFQAPFQGGMVTIPRRLIQSVTTHIETALAMGYVDEIIFSDMGHSHILVPRNIYKNLQSKSLHDMLTILYDHPQTKFLYHTAEQLGMTNENEKLSNNRHLQQRYYTRNLLTTNDGRSEIHIAQGEDKTKFNTVGEWPGHNYMVGFDISANKNGCFPYYDKNNNLRYFDLSPSGHFAIKENQPQQPYLPGDYY